MKNPPLVALLTDFGEDDFFVASLKGVILSINPEARIIDISHRVPSFDLEAAGFILSAACPYFPPATVFLVIVDPAVGTKRRILLVRTKKHFFIAPDNGVLSLALEKEEITELREVTNQKFFLPQASATFEGRDKMAPATAWLTLGVSPEEFGPAASNPVRLALQKPELSGEVIRGRVLYVDKFGNLITNIPASMVDSLAGDGEKEKLTAFVGRRKAGSFRGTYSVAAKGEMFFLFGSVGLIEVASRESSAAQRLGAKRGDEVKIVYIG